VATIFAILYSIHPVAPILFLVVMANGMLTPALLHAFAGVPIDPREARKRAKAGSSAAAYAYYSWLVFAVVGASLVVVVVVAKALGTSAGTGS